MRRLIEAVAEAVSGKDSATDMAHAKVNLALHVMSRRVDGYHHIDSLVAFSDLADVISVKTSSGTGVQLMLDGPFASELDLVSRPNDNLVIRTAEMLAEATGHHRVPPTEILLSKRVPIAAGLGGGSADAAATLRLLNRLWSLGMNEARLAEIGLRLGADVPMCLASRPAFARGIGERLTFISGMPRLPLVLVHPRVPVPTELVYGRLPAQERSPLPPMPARFDSVFAFVIWLRQTRNDLSEPARTVTGLGDAAVKALNADPDCLFARMSGSGAAVFGIFPKISTAERAAERLRNGHPNWWITAVETMGS